MGANLAEADGSCGARVRAFHTEQAKGGLGLIIVGSVGVAWPIGSSMPRMIALSEDRLIPGMKAVADAVHEHGARIALQFNFAGPVGIAEDTQVGRPTWVPSVPRPRSGDMLDGYLKEELEVSPFRNLQAVKYQVLTATDIRYVVEQFAAAAERARRAGIDGIEIHGGHGYLISSFLSPATNQRTDEYGGSLENRARVLTQIIQGIRAAVGRDYPLWCKLDSQEYEVPEGITLADAIQTARLAEAAGVDAITVSGFHDPSKGYLHSGSLTPHKPELLISSAARIKAALKIPVIAAGRIELESAERHIASGSFDFLAMGRKLLADPHLPRKLAAGQLDEIIPCVYCYTCISQIYMSNPVRCAVNPETGLELEQKLRPAAQKKRVAVIGAGPAGMEVARRLALRGHRVSLLERADHLGGNLPFAAVTYQPNERILAWLMRHIAQSDIEVRLGMEMTPDSIAALDVDAIVIATGAGRAPPVIPGASAPNVLNSDDLRRLLFGDSGAAAAAGGDLSPDQVRQATRASLPLGERVVVIGGELEGLGIAEFLARRDRTVSVIDEAPKLGAGLQIVRRWRVLHELDQLEVAKIPGARDIRIEEKAVRYLNPWNQVRTIAADNIIITTGTTTNLRFADALRSRNLTVFSAGDCNGVGYIDGAMHSAARAAAAV
jgi:2,4-dienoyl-CoA reductase-like NADH-dependent reductase (Old Yellow Enzyme family)/NADPH-dependent 2,4-dienoyl-CoA reductase/sulfur reductase-like enzyme